MAARKQYLLRIDPDLWAEVEKWAADELRSVNAQVEYILRDAVRRRRGGRAAGDSSPEPGGRSADGAGSGPDETGNDERHGR
jgi:hypothetical protein